MAQTCREVRGKYDIRNGELIAPPLLRRLPGGVVETTSFKRTKEWKYFAEILKEKVPGWFSRTFLFKKRIRLSIEHIVYDDFDDLAEGIRRASLERPQLAEAIVDTLERTPGTRWLSGNVKPAPAGATRTPTISEQKVVEEQSIIKRAREEEQRQKEQGQHQTKEEPPAKLIIDNTTSAANAA